MRDRSTSAVMLTAPAISAAFGCAPLMPPSPELTYSTPARSCVLSQPQIQPSRVQQRQVRPVHDPLRPDVHPAAGGHLPVVGHAQLRGLVEVGGVVELAHHEPVGVDDPRRVAVAGEQPHRMPGGHHQGLRLGHPLQVLLHQPVLHPVLEHLPRLAVRHQLVRVERHGEIQVVVDVELQRPGLEDAPVLAHRPRLDVAVGSGQQRTAGVTLPRLGPEPVPVDAAALPELRQELGGHRRVQRRRDVAQGVLQSHGGLPRRQREAPVGRPADARSEHGRRRQSFGQSRGHSSRLSTIWLVEKSWICM